jgi:hypothetical protein
MTHRLHIHHVPWITAVIALILAVCFFVLLTMLFAPAAHAVL